MDKFVDFEGVEHDLDDSNLYLTEHWVMNLYRLWQMAEKKAGEALFYMQFMHPPESNWGVQAVRIHCMCRELVDMRMCCLQESRENRLRLLKWLFKFEDEVENQC